MKAKTNPDTEYVKELKKEIKNNGGHCVSARSKSADTKCMCKDFREQIKRGESGYCACGLYYI